MSQKTTPLADHLIQAGRPAKTDGRHVNLPIELGSTIVFDTLSTFEAARDARYETGTMYYGRYGNEATFQLERMLAGLEGAEGVTLTSSGVASISLSLMAFARPGTHLLVADHVYGNTRAFCENVLTPMGVEIAYFDPMIGGEIAALISNTTCAVMFEAPGSGTFEMPDIPAIAAAARASGVPSILDSTWATPAKTVRSAPLWTPFTTLALGSVGAATRASYCPSIPSALRAHGMRKASLSGSTSGWKTHKPLRTIWPPPCRF